MCIVAGTREASLMLLLLATGQVSGRTAKKVEGTLVALDEGNIFQAICSKTTAIE